jgi:hypothetical protein
MTADRFKEC